MLLENVLACALASATPRSPSRLNPSLTYNTQKSVLLKNKNAQLSAKETNVPVTLLKKLNALPKLAVASIILSGIGCFGTPGHATLIVTDATGGVPTKSGVTLENFAEGIPSNLTLSGATLTNGWGGGWTPPVTSGSTTSFFNDSSGYTSKTFIAVNSTGSATFTFSTPQIYFGLLWGTVDSANTLTFYDSNHTVIGTVSGSQLPGYGTTWGADSPYVNITSTTPFVSVTATSPNANFFEFGDVTYATAIVPEPSSIWALFALGIPVACSLIPKRQRTT